jgi:pullulanase/glycogen debranching enzyme
MVGGYLNNGSSGFAPRYWEEPVRQLFISSAVELVEEFHVDGLRVDLTPAIHDDNAVKSGERLGSKQRQCIRLSSPSGATGTWPRRRRGAGPGGLKNR